MYFDCLLPKIREYVLRNDPAWIFLKGDLGAGKTTLVKEFCQSMSQGSLTVQSPTFLKVLEYSVGDLGKVVHMDFYRVEESSEISRFGLENYQEVRVYFLEWPEKFQELLKEQPYWKDLLDCQKVLQVELSADHNKKKLLLSELAL